MTCFSRISLQVTKIAFLWQCLMQKKAMDWQGWISTAYPKEKFAVCIMGLLQCYLFWVFKLQSDIQCRLILSTAAMCAVKF